MTAEPYVLIILLKTTTYDLTLRVNQALDNLTTQQRILN